uniref:Ribosomal protein S10 n=1 Tax=Closterium baillyanum TaxID=1416941 RepID=U5YDU4_9VIRI|nr:ribosomal protein S10 [Closterium baillyanum]AGZ90254.1 ribosomal protein S10 [Closterium baillyanum]
MKVKISIVLKSFEAPPPTPNGKEKMRHGAYSLGSVGGSTTPTDYKLSDDKNIEAKFTERSSLLSIRLPLKQSLYTVLRSPHIDKKSREQFEMKIHKQLIRISTETKQLGFLWNHLKFHEMSGVQMKVIFHYKTRLI